MNEDPRVTKTWKNQEEAYVAGFGVKSVVLKVSIFCGSTLFSFIGFKGHYQVRLIFTIFLINMHQDQILFIGWIIVQ